MLASWAADCAERVLPLFEAQAPNDTRPRAAIAGLQAFARGEMRIGGVRALAARAHAAAREVGDPPAVADEVGWQQRHTWPAVRDVLRRLPPPTRPAGVLGRLINDLHTRLAAG